MKLEKYKMGDSGLMYELRDDIYYPLLSPPDNDIHIGFVGKYGKLAQNYLETTQPFAYSFYSKTPLLKPILERVDEEATEMMHTVMEQLRKSMQPPKSDDFMDKVKYNYQIYNTAEEIVLHDIVYQPHIADNDFKLTIYMINLLKEFRENPDSEKYSSFDDNPF